MAQSPLQISLRRADVVLAYTFLRVIIGINYFNHGFTRIGNIPGFVNAMVERFQDTFIPIFLTQINAFLVPPVELVVGILLIIGLFTRWALVVCLCLMFVLMYGVTLIQAWDIAGSQLIYDLILCILLAGLSFNTFSVDAWWQRRQEKAESPSPATAHFPIQMMPALKRLRRRDRTRTRQRFARY